MPQRWPPAQRDQHQGHGTIQSLYSQGGQLMYQRDLRQGKLLNYIYLGGSLVAIADQGLWGGAVTAKRYQHTDALGTPVAVTDENRNVIERSEYEPYGLLLNRAQHDGPGFTGHVQDALTSLTYMQQRYYDPQIGRFLSVDPVTAESDPVNYFNRYKYANNNPYKFNDPDGRAFGIDDAVGIVVGGLVGVGVEAVKDVATGHSMTAGDAAGAFVGGALLGEGIVNAPETLGGSVVAAGAARGAVVGLVSNGVQQGTDMASGEQKGGYSVTSAAVSTAVGAATGGLATKIGTVRVPGVTSGRNNMAAVAKSVRTRIANGNASNMSAKTMLKGAAGGLVGDSGKTITGGAIDAAKTKVCQKTGGC